MTQYEPVYPKHTWAIAGEDVPAFERDMAALCAAAGERGADFAELIPARHVATDARVTLKCKIPPCECYGQCLMDPPFSPTADETAKIVARYEHAILTEVSMELPQEYWDLIQGDQPLCRLQYDERAIEFDRTVQQALWFRLHDVVMEIERRAHNLGYFFAVGYVASTCYLCYRPDDPVGYCDTTQLCKHPYEARPSMEAAGIDVFSTYHNAGLKLKMGSREKFSWSGLVLVV